MAEVEGKPISNRSSTTGSRSSPAVQRPPKAKEKPAPPKKGSPEYKQLAQQVMQFLVSSLLDRRARPRIATSPPPTTRSSAASSGRKDQSFPTEKAYKRFLQHVGPDARRTSTYRVRLDVLSNKVRHGDHEVTRPTSTTGRSRSTTSRTRLSSRSRSAATCAWSLANKEAKAKEAVERSRPARASARSRRSSRRIRPPSIRAAACSESRRASRRPTSTRRCSRCPKGKLTGPDQDAAGLLRLRGHEDHAGDQAEPGAVQGGHPPAADLAEAAAGAGQVHDQLPHQVARQDRLLESLAHPRLLQRRGAAARRARLGSSRPFRRQAARRRSAERSRRQASGRRTRRRGRRPGLDARSRAGRRRRHGSARHRRRRHPAGAERAAHGASRRSARWPGSAPAGRSAAAGSASAGSAPAGRRPRAARLPAARLATRRGERQRGPSRERSADGAGAGHPPAAA